MRRFGRLQQRSVTGWKYLDPAIPLQVSTASADAGRDEFRNVELMRAALRRRNAAGSRLKSPGLCEPARLNWGLRSFAKAVDRRSSFTRWICRCAFGRCEQQGPSIDRACDSRRRSFDVSQKNMEAWSSDSRRSLENRPRFAPVVSSNLTGSAIQERFLERIVFLDRPIEACLRCLSGVVAMSIGGRPTTKKIRLNSLNWIDDGIS